MQIRLLLGIVFTTGLLGTLPVACGSGGSGSATTLGGDDCSCPGQDDSPEVSCAAALEGCQCILLAPCGMGVPGGHLNSYVCKQTAWTFVKSEYTDCGSGPASSSSGAGGGASSVSSGNTGGAGGAGSVSSSGAGGAGGA